MVKHGTIGVERNPVVWWLLGICFVVDFIWIYRVWSEIAAFTKKDIKPQLKTAMMLVPILNIFILYQMFAEISDMEEMVGIPEEESLNPILNLLFCLVFLLGIFFAQKHLNRIWEKA